MRRSCAGLLLGVACTAAVAQLTPPDPDWKETEAPRPPALQTEGLIELDMERSALRWGIDPRTISIGEDRIVRYVVVATSGSGTVNAMYEGIRCNTGEVKLYARHTPGAGWTPAKEADWQPLHGNGRARHSLVIARSGACLGHGPNQSVEQIARDLRSPANSRFRNEYR
ncbi:MAG TPA: CNP1-like family protein [Ramlibacter sp.]|nr:CNP1-like family protein [Ramlibacter sp.]